MATKKPAPTIRNGDVLMITGYESLLHYDKFGTDSTAKEMKSPGAITFTKKGWGIIPRDVHYVKVAKNTLFNVDIPRSYEKQILRDGYYWELMLEVKRPKR